MPRSPEWIYNTFRERKLRESPMRGRAAEIAAIYDGMVQVPLPEIDKSEQAAVANLVTQGLDQMAARIASVSPQVTCPPLIDGNRSSERNADKRQRAITAWWQENRYQRKLSKRARWLIGYASAPMIIRPDRKLQIPRWELRDPLCTYPAQMPEADEICPTDCIFVLRRVWGWINDRYPVQARQLVPEPANQRPDDEFEIIEYVDDDEHVLIAVGKPSQPRTTPWGVQNPPPQGATFCELDRFPNLLGRCPVVVPTRISLNHARGQFDQMSGLYQMQARAMALFLLSAEKAIFPDVWFVSRPNEIVKVIERPDGRAGIPGQVSGGDLKEVSVAPPPMVPQMIDLLERNMRTTASIPTDFGGEAPSNVRTGRAGEQLLTATVDYWIQEAHQTLSDADEEGNKIAVQIARTYFGNTSKSFYVKMKGAAKGPVDYTPNANFDSDVNMVTWPHAGSDINNLVIGIGQRVGIKEMSIKTAQELDPYIDDAEREHNRILAESMEQAQMAAIDQAVATGQMGPLEVGRLYQLVIQDRMTLFDAFQQVHEEQQQTQMAAQQAQGAPPGPGGMGGPPGGGPPGGPPGGGGPPGAPGLMAPGQQQLLGLGPMNPPGGGVPMPTPGVQHMGQLLGALKKGA